MKGLSIKLQLTVWYSLTIFIVSSMLFVSFYYITERSITLETDRSLLNHASQIAYNIGLNTDNVFDSQTREIIEVSSPQLPGIYINITDIAGHDIKSENDGAFFKLAQKAFEDRKEAFTYQTINGTNLRLISYPIKRGESVIGTVVMGHPVDIYRQALQELRNIALILMLFLIIPSILLGYFLASNATNPINSIAKKMQIITSENLSDRIAIPPRSSEMFNLVTNFNNLLDRLNDAFNRERQFIGEVAHEIKTPLAVIKSNAEVTLSKDRENYEYKNSLTQVLTHVEKLSKRLSSLIDLAWSYAQDVKKHFKRIDISNILKEVCENTQYLAESKKISVECDIENGLFVLGMEDKLFQVFHNIVDNAIKYTEENGKINLSIKKQNQNAVLKISDTGIGIEKNDLQVIFDRFYRLENQKSINGYGLGLAISNSIVKAHGGEILVDSIKSKGTTFTIIIPLSS